MALRAVAWQSRLDWSLLDAALLSLLAMKFVGFGKPFQALSHLN